MNIGLGFDGVFVYTKKLKSKIAREKYDLKISPDEFNTSLISNKILTKEQYGEIQQSCYYDDNYRNQLSSMAGMIIFVRKLISDNHSLSIITARDDISVLPVTRFINKYHIVVPVYAVGREKKKETIQELNLHTYVDNKLRELLPLVGVVQKLYFFSKIKTTAQGIETVSSWKELYEKIRK